SSSSQRHNGSCRQPSVHPIIEGGDPVFGYRARIGYTVPLTAVEVFPYEFYRMVPEGVTLMVATSPPGVEDREQTYTANEAVARDMAQAGVNVIVIGGAS